MSQTTRVILPTILILIVVLTSIAHFHTGTSFTLPLLPTGTFNTFHTYTGLTQPEAENRHFSSAQCLARFPELYLEADRARDWYAAKGGVSKEAVDDAEREGDARLVILDNKVRRLPVRTLSHRFHWARSC